jgi:hypothetical protein
MLAETLLRIPFSVTGGRSLVPTLIGFREKAQELTGHTRLPVKSYRITGGFLYAFPVSNLALGSLKRVTGRIFRISK